MLTNCARGLNSEMKKGRRVRHQQSKASNGLRGPAREIYALERPPQTVRAEDERYFGPDHPDNVDATQLYDDTWPPERAPWGGGVEANKPHKEDELVELASRPLTAHSPTEMLLLAAAHGLAKVNGGALSRRDAEIRLRGAISELAGLPKTKGRRPTVDLEQVCGAVAKEYFRLTLGLESSNGDQTLASLLKTQLGLTDTRDTKPSNDKKIAPYERYFNEHKDRLLLRVSDTHVLDQMRKAKFVAALKELRALGVEVDVDLIEQNWEVL